MDKGVKSPLDSQHVELLLRDKLRIKDSGETQRITAPLHASASLSAQERLRYQTLLSSGGKKISSFSLTFALAACQEFGSHFCMDFQTF